MLSSASITIQVLFYESKSTIFPLSLVCFCFFFFYNSLLRYLTLMKFLESLIMFNENLFESSLWFLPRSFLLSLNVKRCDCSTYYCTKYCTNKKWLKRRHLRSWQQVAQMIWYKCSCRASTDCPTLGELKIYPCSPAVSSLWHRGLRQQLIIIVGWCHYDFITRAYGRDLSYLLSFHTLRRCQLLVNNTKISPSAFTGLCDLFADGAD